MSGDWIARAKVGDKVTCVDTKWPRRRGDDGIVVKPASGVVYTIREVVLREEADNIARVGFLLEEIVNPRLTYVDGGRLVVDEVSFSARRFRPLQARNTDISWAHEILRKATKPIKETI